MAGGEMKSIANRETIRVVAWRAVFVAVVHAADGVRLAVAAGSRAELVRRLAEYAWRRAAHVLRAEHARYVRTLVARGEPEAAVEVYFGLVGERWDKEWLVTAAVPSEDSGGMTALVGAVAPLFDSERTRSREAS
jgi:hypothetical protein